MGESLLRKPGLIGKQHTIAEVEARFVYLTGRKQYSDLHFKVEVHDKLTRDAKGEYIPPTLVMNCPRCQGLLKVDGYSKRVHIEYLNPPRQMVDEGFGPIKQTCMITVEEPMRCSYPRDGALCGAVWIIARNEIYPA